MPLNLPIMGRRKLNPIVSKKRRSPMCGCDNHTSQPSQAVKSDPSALTLRVEDMACGHCADTIRKAIEAGLPGVQVEADPASKLVSVRGSADLTSVKALVTKAGYTPVAG